MAKDNDNVLDTLLGITESPKETMSHASMLRNNLIQQRESIEQEIDVLKGQLNKKREYLAKIEGGIDVLDELEK